MTGGKGTIEQGTRKEAVGWWLSGGRKLLVRTPTTAESSFAKATADKGREVCPWTMDNFQFLI
jgi:hypothetical protein